MKSILQGLYTGDIIPWERRSPPNDRQRDILRKLEDEERYFMSKMSLDDCDRFQKLSQLQAELSVIGEEQLFSYAFTLGLLLAMDAMKESETVFSS